MKVHPLHLIIFNEIDFSWIYDKRNAKTIYIHNHNKTKHIGGRKKNSITFGMLLQLLLDIIVSPALFDVTFKLRLIFLEKTHHPDFNITFFWRWGYNCPITKGYMIIGSMNFWFCNITNHYCKCILIGDGLKVHIHSKIDIFKKKKKKK